MAYTYEDFVSAANKAGLMNQFSQEDLSITQRNPEYGLSLLNLKQDAANAATAEQRALAAETERQIRNSYGGFTGTYSSQIKDLMDTIGNYGSFAYGNEDQLQESLRKVTNPESFSYSTQTDPMWSSLRKSYLREGQRASQNVLEQAAAGSGGIPSSYAVTAANQAANYYNEKLADLIPTLEQNAYQKYLTQYEMQKNALSALQNDKSMQQSQYNERLNVLMQQLANYQQQDTTEYNRYLDALNLAYQQEQQKLENAMKMYNLLGYATPEVAGVLGIDAGKAASASGSNGVSGGSDGTDGSGIDFSSVFSEYADGVITDKDYWNSLAALYGEDALKAAGLRYSEPRTPVFDGYSLKRLGLENVDYGIIRDMIEKGQLRGEMNANGTVTLYATGVTVDKNGNVRGNGKTGSANKGGKKAVTVLENPNYLRM